jgi:hypothetical protein
MGSTAVQAVLVVALLAATGPVLSVATGRLVARRDESR